MFRRFFIGRNGPDQLSLAMTIFAFIISFVPYGFYPSIAIMVLAVYRMVSKNVVKRRSENYRFVMFLNRIKRWYNNKKAQFTQRKYYKIFKCPNCSQRLRVPRNKGRVAVKCTKCGQTFIKRT